VSVAEQTTDAEADPEWKSVVMRVIVRGGVALTLDADCSAASAASAAARFSASEAARAEAQDKLLSDFAEGVVQVLIEMKAPGCQWLDLVPIDAR
jgi:hypothetical protein